MVAMMIISTSSHDVQLADDICEFVEHSLHDAFGQLADHVLSVDARLEVIHSAGNRKDVKAVVRVDLCDHRALVTEVEEDNLHMAIRRSAIDSARAANRLLQNAPEVTGHRPEMRPAFDCYSIASI